MIKKINVNELREILEKHFRWESSCTIEKVDVASIENQYNPETKIIGVSGVLNLYVLVSK